MKENLINKYFYFNIMITDQKGLTQDELDKLVVKPTENYHGRSYGDFAKEFMQWLVQYNPDNQSLKDVIFLRGVDFEGYQGNLNHRFVKIGNDALQVYSDQAIFCTVITSLADKVHHNLDSPEKRRDYVNQLVQIGDNPPLRNQFSVDGLHPNIDWNDFKVITEDFTVYVPEPIPGKTLGQILDVPFNIPGPTECVVGGYFILLRPLPAGRHIITSFGNGDFDYRNQTFVELNVVSRGTSLRPPSMFPVETKTLTSAIEAKIKAKEIFDIDIYYDALNSLGPSEDEIKGTRNGSENQIGEFEILSKKQEEELVKARERAKKMLEDDRP